MAWNAPFRANADLAESPVWDADEAVLWWVDIFRGEVHRLDPASGRDEMFQLEAPVGSLALRAGGGLLLALRDGVYHGAWETCQRPLQDPRWSVPTIASTTGELTGRGVSGWAACTSRRANRPVRSTGSILMDGARGWPTASTPPTERRSRPTAPVGYHADSRQRVVWRFDCDPETGALANRRVFISLEPRSGAPDGAIVDADGFYWLTHAGGWRIVRYDPLGRVDRIVQLPVETPTSAAFGGADCRTLFITTARYGLDERVLAMQPLAGSILAIDVGVTGMPDTKFAG